jgi:dienelactone hydrolase
MVARVKPGRGVASLAALAATLLLVPVESAATGAAPAPAAAAAGRGSLAAADGSRWSTERTAAGWRVTLRTAEPVALRDDRPVLLADGRRLGVATMAPDARTFTVTTSDPRILRARTVELGWYTDPGPGAARATAAPETSAEWIDATGPAMAEDPAAPGPFAVEKRDYNLGNDALTLPSMRQKSEMRGRLYLPTGAQGRRPVVLFLHGMHDVCYGEPTGPWSPWPCSEGMRPVLNYGGYDAMGRVLASHGYVVASLSANAVNAYSGAHADSGAQARSDLVLAHLGLLRRSDAGTGPLKALQGRLDLSRVGLMGHSRGGEGVVRAALDNTQRTNPYGIRGLFLLAPTDFTRTTVPGVSTSVLLPYCDGDVSDLHGQHYYDDTNDAVEDDGSFKSSLLMLGANHNFFNREWSPGSVSGSDDWPGRRTQVCGSEHPGRLTQREQRAAGAAFLAGFFRTTLAREAQFLPMFDGSGATPASAGRAVIRATYAAPARARLDVARLDDGVPADAASGGATLEQCVGMVPLNVAPGEAPEMNNSTAPGKPACTDDLMQPQASHWAPSPLVGNAPGTAVGHLRWTTDTGRVQFNLRAGSADVSRFEALSMRMSPDPAVDERMDLTIRVSDGAGNAATVPVSEVSDALRPLPGAATGRLPHTQLRTVRVPLALLAGVDLTDVRAVELLTDRTPTGAAYLADVAFVRASVGRSGPVGLPTLTLSGRPRLAEGAQGTTSQAQFFATLSAPSPSRVTATFSARADKGEVVPSPGESTVVKREVSKVVIPAGQTRVPLTVPVLGNDRHGLPVAISVGLTHADGAVLDKTWGSGLVLDEDPMPSLRIGRAEATEDAGVLRFPVTLSTPSDRIADLAVRLDPGTARRGADYDVGSRQMAYTFVPVGRTRAYVKVRLVDDTVAERTETFTATVIERLSATEAGPDTVTGTILDDD